MMAVSIDVQRLLDVELLAAPLGTTEGQAAIEQARTRFGLDPRELEVLAAGSTSRVVRSASSPSYTAVTTCPS